MTSPLKRTESCRSNAEWLKEITPLMRESAYTNNVRPVMERVVCRFCNKRLTSGYIRVCEWVNGIPEHVCGSNGSFRQRPRITVHINTPGAEPMSETFELMERFELENLRPSIFEPRVFWSFLFYEENI
jgi:hypothetical protein